MNARRSLTFLGSLTALSLCLAFALPAGQNKAPAADAFSGTYGIDAVHSTVIFRIKHLNTSWSFGRFNQVKGEVKYDAAKPESSSVTVEIDIASLDTASKKRDDHLKSPDFFDAVQFPTATFESKSVKKLGDKKLSVTGDLDLHGVTKPVTIELDEVGTTDSPKMGVRAGFYGVVTIKRSDFGISFMPDALGDEVQLTVSIEAVRTDGAK